MTRPAQNSRPLLVNGEALRVAVEAAPRGGGEKFEPQTAEQARNLLLPLLDTALSAVSVLEPQFRTRQLYVEARLLPNYIAASDYPDHLLTQVGAVPVGSRSDVSTYRTRTRERQATTRRLVLAVDDAGLSRLRSLVATGGQTRSETQAFAEIRKFDDIGVAEPNQVIIARPGEPEMAPTAESTEAGVLWEAVFHPETSRGGTLLPQSADVLQQWAALVQRFGGVVYAQYDRTVGGLTFAPVRLPPAAVDVVARFNPLRVLRPMPALRPRPSITLRSGSPITAPASRQPRQSEPRVAVFDGGLRTPSTILFPQATLDLTSHPAADDLLDHGTGVVAATMHGLVRPGEALDQVALPVDSLRVLPAQAATPGLEVNWVLDQIKHAVIEEGYKIVNLSLGPEEAIEEDDEPNLWTSELDQLAWEHDVLFVVAAGNTGDADEATGLNRLQVPADMANGLAVGACDQVAPTTPWQRAPYSSIGPGRHGNRVAPTGVQFGGVTGNLFPVLATNGSFLEASGTSFSTPLHTHALMELCTRLPRANANILRAFSVHFAERRRSHQAHVHEHGFGRLPLSFDDCLEAGPDATHVLYVGEIERAELQGYQVPIPTGFGRATLHFTLAYASPVEPSQPTEYTQASLDMTFRPHRHLHRFNPPRNSGQKATTLDERSDDALVLIRAGWTQSQEPVSKPLGPNARAEVALRDAGKWETLRHHRLSLPAAAADTARLEIAYLARRTGVLDSSPPAVPFALLISTVDPDDSGLLYDQTITQFAALRPIARATGRVRVRAGESRTRIWR